MKNQHTLIKTNTGEKTRRHASKRQTLILMGRQLQEIDKQPDRVKNWNERQKQE